MDFISSMYSTTVHSGSAMLNNAPFSYKAVYRLKSELVCLIVKSELFETCFGGDPDVAILEGSSLAQEVFSHDLATEYEK
ncbi:hypothetical protein AgCh_013203 [Apium graveolens]